MPDTKRRMFSRAGAVSCHRQNKKAPTGAYISGIFAVAMLLLSPATTVQARIKS